MLKISQIILIFVTVLTSVTGYSTNMETVTLGDIEGQKHRLDSFFHSSNAFKIDLSGQVILKNGYQFVFMGDAIDKGESSLYILESLISLKERYPNRVILILGNRDINKLRLPNELSNIGLNNTVNEDATTQKFDEWSSEKDLPENKYNDGPTRLKWILEKTMGAPDAFEFRRKELLDRLNKPVSDIDVFESFLEDFDKSNGIMSKYLRSAQLAFIDHNNRSLFVHGGLTVESFGVVPGVQDKIPNLKNWVKNLNTWAYNLIEEGIENKSGAKALVEYQQPTPGTRANQASVVYGRNFDASANPELIPESLQDILIKQGIDTIVVGHTPVGEIPVVVSNEKFRIVFIDNSFSKSGVSASVSLKNSVLMVSAKSPLNEFSETISYEHILGEDSLIGSKSPNGIIVGVQNSKALAFKIDMNSGFKPIYEAIDKPVGAIMCNKLLDGQ